MKFTYEGKEYEFRGEYKSAELGDYYLSIGKCISRANHDHHSLPVAIVHPVEKLHTFGGVEFRETGEVRQAGHNDWYLFGRAELTPTLSYGPTHTTMEYPILEPVRIIG